MFNFFKKSPEIQKLPFLVDIHSHLLPGIDDGVKSFEESLHILKILEGLGYKKIITTPHVMSDYYKNTSESILTKLQETKEFLKDKKIDIKLEAAAEYYLDENFIDQLMGNEKLLTLGDNYLLFETSFLNKPAFLEDAVFNINTQGYKPVLAHPERYSYLQSDEDLISNLKNMGLYFQLNYLSLTGFYSKSIQKFAVHLLKRNLIDFIGTDCHNAYQASEIIKSLRNRNMRLLMSKNFKNSSLL